MWAAQSLRVLGAMWAAGRVGIIVIVTLFFVNLGDLGPGGIYIIAAESVVEKQKVVPKRCGLRT